MEETPIGIDHLVISAVNFTEAGPLTVLRDCVNSLHDNKYFSKITLFVNDGNLLDFCDDNITVIEWPQAKRSYVVRLYFEYFWCYWWSTKFAPDAWLALHDMTPNVKTKFKIVYCHNPLPFLKFKWRYFFFSPKTIIFSLLYRYVYRINIKSNDLVVVQQDWLMQEFQNMFMIDNLVVCHPIFDSDIGKDFAAEKKRPPNQEIYLVYPAFPRVFKNIEFACDLIKEANLSSNRNINLILTLSGTENLYSRWLFFKYRHDKNILFHGQCSKLEMQSVYSRSDGLLFTSLLETWGLPLSEAQQFSLPIFAIDTPHAREATQGYIKVKYLPLNDKERSADVVRDYFDGVSTANASVPLIPPPHAVGWKKFWDYVVRRFDEKV